MITPIAISVMEVPKSEIVEAIQNRRNPGWWRRPPRSSGRDGFMSQNSAWLAALRSHCSVLG